MVKLLIICWILCLALIGFSQPLEEEVLSYKMKYGWFELGRLEVYTTNTNPYERGSLVYSQARFVTRGIFRLLRRFDTCFELQYDSTTFLPDRAHRNLKFGSKIDVRTDQFFYGDTLLRIETFEEDRDRHKFRSHSTGEVRVLDLLSTFAWLRTLQSEVGDSVSLVTFFDSSFYPISMARSAHPNPNFESYWLYLPESKYFSGRRAGQILANKARRPVPVYFEIFLKFGVLKFELDES